MKKFSLFLLTIVLISSVSCIQETQEPLEQANPDVELIEMSFDAGICGKTKVEVGTPTEGGYKTFWSPGDEIAVYPWKLNSTETDFYVFSSDLDQASPAATFSGLVPAADQYYAFYPCGDYTWDPQNQVVTMNAEIVHYADGKVDSRLYAKAEDGVLNFQHVTGYIKFTIPEGSPDISRVRFTAPNYVLRARSISYNLQNGTVDNATSPSSVLYLYRPLDGDRIAPGTYHMASLPANIYGGFYLEFFNKDGLIYKKAASEEAKIVAGQILNFGEIKDIKFDYPVSTIEQMSQGNDGEYFRLQGTVVDIDGTTHGDWNLEDETGCIKIYGTFDDVGMYDWSYIGLNIGDFVTIQGQKSTYRGAPQLVDVSVVEKVKSCVRIESTTIGDGNLPSAAGEFSVNLALLGEEVEVEVSENATEWIRLSSISYGENSAVVKFTADENIDAMRPFRLTFRTKDGNDRSWHTACNFYQDGATKDALAGELCEMTVSSGFIYRLTGCVNRVKDSKYGNMYISDHTGEIYIYRTYDKEGNRFDAMPNKIRTGDIITVSGYWQLYAGRPELSNVVVEKHTPSQLMHVAEFKAAEENSETYYSISGEVTSISSDSGHFELTDVTGIVRVAGLAAGWGGEKVDLADLNIKVGDHLNIVGQRSTYEGEPELVNAFFLYSIDSGTENE